MNFRLESGNRIYLFSHFLSAIYFVYYYVYLINYEKVNEWKFMNHLDSRRYIRGKWISGFSLRLFSSLDLKSFNILVSLGILFNACLYWLTAVGFLLSFSPIPAVSH